jgi:leucyl/phenylalanyl-tRNA--protein transferase
MVRLDPETLIEAYCNGVFPMADADGQIRWYTADPRGIIPLDNFHIPKTLAQFMRGGRNEFEIRINHDFEKVMHECMEARSGQTWINPRLIKAYLDLHDMKLAHSVEVWRRGELAGGLYGVSIRGAFFGESMFHHVRDASKVALVHLVERLRNRGYELLDSQASTQHLRRFGCIEVSAEEYAQRLRSALDKDCSFV